MVNEIEILNVNLNDRHIGCAFDEVNRVVTDVSGISGNGEMPGDNVTGKKAIIYTLGDILNIPEKVQYDVLLVIGTHVNKHMYIAIPAITDIVKLKISQISVVPEYIRRKQDPFVVWGFSDLNGKMIMLITFAYYFKAKHKDGNYGV